MPRRSSMMEDVMKAVCCCKESEVSGRIFSTGSFDKSAFVEGKRTTKECYRLSFCYGKLY